MRLLVLLALLLAAAPAAAEDWSPDACPATMDPADCAWAEHERLEARLSTVLDERLAYLPAEIADRLRGAQDAWLAYRETSCELEAALDPSLSRRARAYCFVGETQDRIRYVEALELTPP